MAVGQPTPRPRSSHCASTAFLVPSSPLLSCRQPVRTHVSSRRGKTRQFVSRTETSSSASASASASASTRLTYVPMVRFSRAPGFGAVEELDLFLRRSSAAAAAAAAAVAAGLAIGAVGGAGRPSPKLAPRVAFAPVVELVDDGIGQRHRVIVHRSFDAF